MRKFGRRRLEEEGVTANHVGDNGPCGSPLSFSSFSSVPFVLHTVYITRRLGSEREEEERERRRERERERIRRRTLGCVSDWERKQRNARAVCSD